MDTNRTIQITAGNMARLDHEIAKINRRADKIECPHIGYTILGSKMVPSPDRLKQLQEHYGQMGMNVPADVIENLPLVEMNTVEIIGEGPKIEGWKFVGTLDHYTIPDKVIVNTVPGETVPNQYYDHAATCDHCEKIRNRIETFVLEGVDDNAGDWKLVGRNCLKDFFGHDPMTVARFLNRVWSFMDDIERDGWGGTGRATEYLNAKAVLTTTVAVVRTFGWVAKSRAEEGQEPTSVTVAYVMLPPVSGREQWQQVVRDIKFDNDRDQQEADDAIAWLKEQTANNEYMHNLKLLEDQDDIPLKMIGYWCSLIPAYRRTLEKDNRERKLNEHYGEVNTRAEIHVKCVGIIHTQGGYGHIAIHRMLTEAGHTLIWFANTDAKMEVDGTYNIRARIKKHDEYKGWKQTVLSRVTVVDREDGV